MAQLKTIKKGSKGKQVTQWQTFLRGVDIYKATVDGDFGKVTHKATCTFQKRKGLYPDGIVGNATYGAAMANGFDSGAVENKNRGKEGPNWPAIPKGLKPLSYAKRDQVFGHIAYKPAPTKGNPEGIVITNNWTSKYLTKIVVPQMKELAIKKPGMGWLKSGKIFIHKHIKDDVLELFQAWEDAGLIDQLETWAGSWCPRFGRGSNSILSNHSWATAFDINVSWNYLGQQPALVGQKGSVRELVKVANKSGKFYWGGYGWGTGHLDGMHFEHTGNLTPYD
jgi:peptidoglycan hydrolase-like protein with peptidoglycan-binding domain